MNENQALKDWNVEGAFARSYSMFGLLVLVLFSLLWLANIYDIFLVLVVTLLVFEIIDTRFSRNIQKMLKDPEFSFPFTTFNVILQSMICIFFATIMTLVYFDFFNFTINSMESISVVVAYIKSFTLTMIFLNIYEALKIILAGLRIASTFRIKRGLFGILHRAVLFLRSAFVTYRWLALFSHDPNIKLIPIIISQEFNICKMYLIAKSIFFAELIWDFDIARYTFYNSYRKLSTPNPIARGKPCIICQVQDVPQAELNCGHNICLECLDKSMKISPFCPNCNEPVIKDAKIAFFDGSISLAAIFCAF